MTDTTKATKAKSFKLTLNDDGTLVDSITITTDTLTTATATDADGSYVDVTTEPIALFSASAQDNAAYHLISNGEIVTHGISKTEKVLKRFALIMAEELRLHIIEESADVPRPKSSQELEAENARNRSETVARMLADGSTPDDVAAYLLTA